MKKTLLFGFCAWLLAIGKASADNTLSVGTEGVVEIPQGGQAVVQIVGSFDSEFVGGQLDLELPSNGMFTPVMDSGKPMFALGFAGTDHTLANSKVGDNSYRTLCASLSNSALPASGTIITITLTASENAVINQTYDAKLTGIEFGTKGGDKWNPADVSFSLKVVAPLEQVPMSQESATAPAKKTTPVDVTVTRTINANEWSTICLPFAMTESQVKEAFGSDVQLAEFTGWNYEGTEDDVTAINVKFTTVAEIRQHIPCIIKVSKAVSSFKVYGVTVGTKASPKKQAFDDEEEYAASMNGTYKTGTVAEGQLFISNNKFYYSTGNTSIMGFRATFDFGDIVLNEAAASRIIMSFDDATTGLQTVKSPNAKGTYYNLGGLQVDNPTKGIYVNSGKTVIIKK